MDDAVVIPRSHESHPRRVRKRLSLVAGPAIFILICTTTIVGTWADPVSAIALHTSDILHPPSARYLLGTDALGRDMLARLLSGGSQTLIVALPAAIMTFLLGLLYGLASGLAPRWLDSMLMRVVDTALAIPSMIALIFFVSLNHSNQRDLIMLLGLVSWPSTARLVRNEVVAVKQGGFVLAARQMGFGGVYIARVHIVRVMMPILAVTATLLVGEMVSALSALSFLGLGVQPPLTSWGGLLQNGLSLIALRPWWLILPPGLMIVMTLFATSLLSDALADRRTGSL